jgi:hypothetical protein
MASKMKNVPKKGGIPRMGVGGLINTGFFAYDAISGMSEGKGVVKSVVDAGVSFAINDAMFGLLGGPASFAIMGAELLGIGVDAAMTAGRAKAQGVEQRTSGFGKVGGYNYNDNQYSATMRQRALQSIGGNQGVVRNAFGNEARKRAFEY